MTIKGLLERKSAVYTEMQALAHNVRKDNRDFSADEQMAFDKADADYKEIEANIQRLERANAYEADMSAKDVLVQADAPKLSTEERYSHAFKKYVRGGNASLSNDEKALLVEKRVNVSDNNAKGAFTVSTALYDQFVETMKYFAPVLNEVNVIRTASGQPMDFTTFNETNKTASFVGAQGSTITEDEMAFGTTSIAVHTAATMVKLSWELLQDNEFNIEGEMGRLLGERVGRLLESAYTNGTGTNEPFGIVTDAGAGITAASASAFTRNELVQLIHSIDPAYRARGAKFMFNDSTLSAIKQLAIGSADARPLWQPPIREGAPDTIDGFGYVINQAMDDVATGDIPVIFGEFNCYYAREAGALSLRRLDERFADSLVSGFLLYGRYGGKLVKSDAVKKLTMA